MKTHSTFFASGLTSYKIFLLSASHMTIHHCQNPATLLPLPSDGMPHSCVINMTLLSCPRLDLSENSLYQVDLTLHVKVSYLQKEDGAFQAGYAIPDQHKPLAEYWALRNITSAQAAKLTAFTRARIRAGMKVNIYTDNCYAFQVVHDFDML